MPDVKILGIPGSLRQASFNRFALRAAQSLLPPGASLDEKGELTDETSKELIRKLLAELVAWTTRLKR